MSLKDLLQAGIKDRAVSCSDAARIAYDRPVQVRYVVVLRPCFGFPRQPGGPTRKLHEGFAAQFLGDSWGRQQILAYGVVKDTYHDDVTSSGPSSTDFAC